MVQGRTHRMTEMIARLAPGATVAAGAGRGRRGLCPHAERSPGRVRSRLPLSRRGHPLQGSAGRAGPADALAAHGRRGVRHDHLGRERRQPDAHARRAPRARAGGARRAGRRRGAAAAAAAGRESRADASWVPASACSSRSAASGCSPRSPSGTRPRASEIRLDGVVLGFTLALVGRPRAAALVPGVAAEGGHLCVLDLRRGAPDERQPEEAAAAARLWSSPRSPSPSCCSPAPDCSRAR